MTAHRRDREVLLVITAFALLAVALGAVTFVVGGNVTSWRALAVLSILGVISWIAAVPDVRTDVLYSFLSIIVLASIPILGPFGAALVATVSVIWDRASLPVRVRVFNAAMHSVAAMGAGLAYLALGGLTAAEARNVDGVLPLMTGVGFPLIVADVVQAVSNAVLLGTIVAVSRGASFGRYVLDLLRSSGPVYIGYGVVGFLFVVLWLPAKTGLVSAVLIAAPLFVARWALVQSSEESKTHEMTVNALVAALEAKDPSSVGHAERVALLAGWVGEEFGIASDRQRLLVLSARLHDIGRVALPIHLLWPPEPPVGADLGQLARHPAIGVELLQGIEFLVPAYEGIMHHHERFDGLGYPAGLVGDRIPLAARIIAAADAFDALTVTAFRHTSLPVGEALTQLRERAGTHLDPVVVECLATCVARREWPPAEHLPTVPVEGLSAVDHDTPSMSDWYADQRSTVTPTVTPAVMRRPE